MSRAYDHHRPCPCGAELADECPSCARTNPLGSMQLRAPGDRTGWRPSGTALLRISESADEPMITGGLDPNQRDWWSNNHEAVAAERPGRARRAPGATRPRTRARTRRREETP